MVNSLKKNGKISRKGPVVLVIMDGVGFGKYKTGDAVAAAHTEILDKLFSLLKNSGFNAKRQAMFSGDKINHTEGRAVLHTALRTPADNAISVDEVNIIPDIQQTLSHIEAISNDIRSGKYKGTTGKRHTLTR